MFSFHPVFLGEIIQMDFFCHMGWFNHQLDTAWFSPKQTFNISRSPSIETMEFLFLNFSRNKSTGLTGSEKNMGVKFNQLSRKILIHWLIYVNFQQDLRISCGQIYCRSKLMSLRMSKPMPWWGCHDAIMPWLKLTGQSAVPAEQWQQQQQQQQLGLFFLICLVVFWHSDWCLEGS